MLQAATKSGRLVFLLNSFPASLALLAAAVVPGGVVPGAVSRSSVPRELDAFPDQLTCKQVTLAIKWGLARPSARCTARLGEAAFECTLKRAG